MYLVYLLLSLLVVAAYIKFSSYWISIGGVDKTIRKNISFEFLLITLLLSILYFPEVPDGFLKYISLLLPVILMYVSFDFFFSFFSRIPRVSDFKNILTLPDASPGVALIALGALLVFLVSISYTLYAAYMTYQQEFYLNFLLRLVIFTGFVFVVPSSFFVNIHKRFYKPSNWSEELPVKYNGRLSSFIFGSNLERRSFSFLRKYKDQVSSIKEKIFSGSVRKRKNIHIVVMESFIDPRLIKSAEFSISPVHEDLLPFLIDGSFSIVTSPVYGGKSCQAEFELLTGVAALAKVNSVEFNVMKGMPVGGFVNFLKHEGYDSIASVAANSKYYNTPIAYKSLGINKAYFLEERDDYSIKKGYAKIFDGDLLDYNFGKIKSIIEGGNTPLISYAVGFYGHFPYNRNMKEQPDVIKESFADERIKKVANLFFYRTQAIAKYIKDIIAIDPDSIIYITSDHLPPLLDNGIEYELDDKSNIAIMIKDKKVIDVSGKKYFEIPWLIWGWISDEDHDRNVNAEEMQTLYFKLLSESL